MIMNDEGNCEELLEEKSIKQVVKCDIWEI
jgi:hypothetical protein